MNYNFINVAVGAWGSSQYTLFTELYCKKIKPKKIIVFMNTDDMYRGYNSGFYKIEKNKCNVLLEKMKKEKEALVRNHQEAQHRRVVASTNLMEEFT